VSLVAMGNPLEDSCAKYSF